MKNASLERLERLERGAERLERRRKKMISWWVGFAGFLYTLFAGVRFTVRRLNGDDVTAEEMLRYVLIGMLGLLAMCALEAVGL